MYGCKFTNHTEMLVRVYYDLVLQVMKRSVSPQTVLEEDSKSKKRRLFGLFSTLKHALIGSDQKQEDDQETAKFINQVAIPTDFTSRKRKHSVQESLKNMSQQVPRSSPIVGSATYQTLSNSLQSEKEAAAGELEQRRMSIVAAETEMALNYVPRNQILPINPEDMELERNVDLPIVIEHEFAPLYKDGDGNLVRPPFINLDPRERYHLLQLKKSLEASEFLQNRLKYMVDPDETTSIIRPNNKVDSSTQTYNKEFLDKSLHFNALRTKLALKSRKQRRSKRGRGMFSGDFYYEPEEAKVEAPSDSKMIGYLGKLSQPAFNTSLSKKTTPKPLPDDDSGENFAQRKKLTSQRAGLEESIRSGQAKDVVLDEDYLKRTERISSIIKLKNQPSPDKKPSVGPSSAFNFEINKNDFGSILQKRKEDDELVQRGSTPAALSRDKQPALSTLKASSLFGLKPTCESAQKPPSLFEEKATTLKSLFGASTETEDRPTKRTRSGSDSGTNGKVPLFGQKTQESTNDESKAPRPAFSFNVLKPEKETKETSASSIDSSEATTTPLFGKPNDSSDASSKPLFSFGAKAPTGAEGTSSGTPKPLFAFGPNATKGVDLKKGADSPIPSFSFGKTSSSAQLTGDNKQAPSFSFGSKKESASSTSTGVLFGSKPTETPNLASDEKKSDAPKFSFGEKKTETTTSFSPSEKKAEDTPSFSFGEKKADTTPSFSFGEKKAAKIPPFSFGSKSNAETPKLLFGKSTEEQNSATGSSPTQQSAEDAKTPAGSESITMVGAAQENGKDANGKTDQNKEAPKFSFGASAAADTPKFLFTTKSEPVPAFSFASKSDEKKENSETPKFVFGQTTTPSAKKADSETSAPTFSFENKEATPNFSFGQKTGESANKDTTSVFSLSSKETTPKPQFSGTTDNATKLAFSFANPAAPASTGLTPFSFGNMGTSQLTESSKPAFSFGQTATADPALIFGGGATAPAFNFSASKEPAPFGTTPAIPTGSGFGNPTPSFGGNPSTPFTFGGAAHNIAAPTPQTGAFGNGGFGSRVATPTSTPGFGQSQPLPNPASVFGGGNNGQQMPGFSFNANVGGANAAPAFNSAPGSFGLVSRENTPPVFGGNQTFNGQVPGQLFTPPLAMKGRKFAQMRPRKRF